MHDSRRGELDRSNDILVYKGAAKGGRSKLVLAVVMMADVKSIRVWLAPEHVALFHFPKLNHHVLSPAINSFAERCKRRAIGGATRSVCLLV